MKKIRLLAAIMLGFAQVSGTEADYSKMSAIELNEALVTAVKKGSYDQVHKLVQLGANPHQKITYTQSNYDDYDSHITCTFLEYAAKNGYVDVVKELIQTKPKIDAINEALIVAAAKGHGKVVAELVKAKPKVDAVNTALLLAAEKGFNNAVTELLKAKPKADALNTALLLAAKEGCPNVVTQLIQAGANVNHANKSGETALILAIQGHEISVVEILLATPKINLKHADNNGNTALITAFHRAQFTYIAGSKTQYNACINSQKILEKLFQTPGSNPHHANKRGETAVKLLAELKSRPGF